MDIIDKFQVIFNIFLIKNYIFSSIKWRRKKNNLIIYEISIKEAFKESSIFLVIASFHRSDLRAIVSSKSFDFVVSLHVNCHINSSATIKRSRKFLIRDVPIWHNGHRFQNERITFQNET